MSETNQDSPSCSSGSSSDSDSDSDSDCNARDEDSSDFEFSPEHSKEVNKLYRDFFSMRKYVEQRAKTVDQMQAQVNELRLVMETNQLDAIYNCCRNMLPVIYYDNKTKQELFTELYSLYERVCNVLQQNKDIEQDKCKKWKDVDQLDHSTLITCFDLCQAMRDYYDAGCGPITAIELCDYELSRDLQQLKTQLETHCCCP